MTRLRKSMMLGLIVLSFLGLSSISAKTQNTLRITGRFYYLDQNGIYQPIIYVRIEIWELDSGTTGWKLATSYIGNTPTYDITVNTIKSPPDIRARLGTIFTQDFQQNMPNRSGIHRLVHRWMHEIIHY